MGLLAGAGAARAGERPLAAMTCRVEAGSGRLLCTVSVTAPPGRTIAWSDAVVVAAPNAARPLRNRVACRSDHPDQVVLAFLLGSGAGGRIEIESRAVACPRAKQAGACSALTRRVDFDYRPPA